MSKGVLVGWTSRVSEEECGIYAISVRMVEHAQIVIERVTAQDVIFRHQSGKIASHVIQSIVATFQSALVDARILRAIIDNVLAGFAEHVQGDAAVGVDEAASSESRSGRGLYHFAIQRPHAA